MKRFTVITICLNMENEIAETIRSVLEQDCDDFEYIIKDGCSKDKTVEIAESFAVDFEKRGISYQIISSPDKGVYDAMNQATKEARGEWVIYMNAGDRFAGKTVLSRVEKSELLESAEIVYGDRILKDHNLYLYGKAGALEEIRFRWPICHQSIFTRRELLEKVPYSVRYRIVSDYRFYLQMYYEGKKFAYLPVVVSISDINGISSNSRVVCQEKLKMFEEMPIRDEEAIQRTRNLLKKVKRIGLWRELFRKFVPKQLQQMRRQWVRRKDGWKTEKEFLAEFERNGQNPW